MKKLTWPLQLTSLFFLLYLANHINQGFPKPPLYISAEQSKRNYNKQLLDLFSLGNKRLWSAILWVDTLLDSDVEHYKEQDGNSWMYYRFDTITNLDSKFLQAYQFGGPYLSVIKDDVTGADKIYRRGLQNYPNDFNIVWNAAFHSYFEMHDVDRAIHLFSKIKNDPQVPPFIHSLLAKMEAERGDLETAFLLMKTTYENAQEGSVFKQRLYNSMYSLKAEMDLNCLNQKLEDCATKDLNGDPYVKINGRFQARKEWQVTRPTTR